jgi:hypothetical protein
MPTAAGSHHRRCEPDQPCEPLRQRNLTVFFEAMSMIMTMIGTAATPLITAQGRATTPAF